MYQTSIRQKTIDRIFDEGFMPQFCNANGAEFKTEKEHFYRATVSRGNRNEDRLTPQHWFPALEVRHSPLSIYPSTWYEDFKGPCKLEEQHIRG